MTLTDINKILSQIAEQKTREKILEFSFGLLKWMGITPNGENKPQLLSTQTQKLKEYLANAPQTLQAQLYRMSADGQNIRVRFAVLKKLKKEYINQLVDNDPGLTTYQASVKGIINIPGRPQYIPSQPYYVHFVTTPDYDKLVLIFNQGEQKRVLVFRNRLSQTQFDKILPAWQNISALSKPEIAKHFWDSLDVKEVNKEFYKHIKEQFDSLVGIAKSQNKDFDESMTKQFAVRLIGRYIFCWFLKEKEIIPEALLSSETIEKYKGTYFQTLLTKLFFKTLNAEVTNAARTETLTVLDDLYKNIPYLNGGLFDLHPEDVLFEILDLNEWLIKFVLVLENFDFTVDESSSQYQHVAIDPEMLGRIFENLLASQNPDTEKMANQRKAFGAFYTPREIVDYMVNESLKAFVETQLFPQLPDQADKASEPSVEIKGTLFQDVVTEPQNALYNSTEIAEIESKRERLKIKINKLFAPDCSENPFDKDETIQLRKALSEISVLDPACGSGAFPMGIMLRLMELRQIIGHGHRNNYDLKEEILSKNIFGVDIMPMAVEIARLRAWLSLVLESDYKPADRKNNFGIAALPNLDFKFVCANSLIDSGYDAFLEKSHYNATLYRLDGEIQKLEQLRNSYFDPQGDKNKKEELQKEFLKTKDYIKTEFKSLKKSWNLEDFLSKVDDWNPFDDSHPSSFFSPAWMFGIRHGFDVVIGNPPYGVRMDSYSRKYLSTKYPFIPDYEIYLYFIAHTLHFLKRFSCLYFIQPNTFLAIQYGKKFRKLLLNYITEIVDLSTFAVFEYANVRTCILSLKLDLLPIDNIKLKSISNNLEIKIVKTIDREYLFANNNNWLTIFSTNEAFEGIIAKLKKNPILSTYCYTSRGYIAYRRSDLIKNYGEIKGNQIIDEKQWHSTIKLADDYLPEILGKDLSKYYFNKRELYIKYGKHLASYVNLKFYQEPHIAVREIAEKSLICSWINGVIISLSSTHLIILKDEISVNLKIILAILNSKLLGWYHYNTSSKAKKGMFPKVLVDDINNFPIPLQIVNYENRIVELVNQILKSGFQTQNYLFMEKEIDVLVYKLYELTYEEVKIIDKDFWLSEEEYNAIKI